jgi:sulfur relay (sulfurtransferase) complex TusBCD TusD component (DsrE family)
MRFLLFNKNLNQYKMKVAYIFRTDMASTFQLATMILPQLEKNIHGVEVVGMFFFDDNTYVLRKGNSIGERLNSLAREKGMLIMACDQCALRRDLAEGNFDLCGTGSVKPKNMIEVGQVGCFPQFYKALSDNLPDLVITL